MKIRLGVYWSDVLQLWRDIKATVWAIRAQVRGPK